MLGAFLEEEFEEMDSREAHRHKATPRLSRKSGREGGKEQQTGSKGLRGESAKCMKKEKASWSREGVCQRVTTWTNAVMNACACELGEGKAGNPLLDCARAPDAKD
mmetsp:Transcript_41730/g.82381  ORF Transcript_41730/g.82381 Transcript_41730/m.82381 type:complete len:106 (-) Transcript_41730:1363-1680(-)